MGACVLGNVFVIMVVWVLVAVLVASAVGRMVHQLLLTRLPRGVLRIAVGVAVSFFLVNLVLLWLSQASFARTPWWALFPGGLFANAMVLKRLWDAVGADAASAKPFSGPAPRAPVMATEVIDPAASDAGLAAESTLRLPDAVAPDGGVAMMESHQASAANGSPPRQSHPDAPMPGPNTAARPMAQRVKLASVTNADESLPSAGASAMPGKLKRRLFGAVGSRAQEGDGADLH
jgi:hypothetical protein